jgi:hypothetical protein
LHGHPFRRQDHTSDVAIAVAHSALSVISQQQGGGAVMAPQRRLAGHPEAEHRSPPVEPIAAKQTVIRAPALSI